MSGPAATGVFFAIVCVLLAGGGAVIALRLDATAAKHPVLTIASFAITGSVGAFTSLAIGGIL